MYIYIVIYIYVYTDAPSGRRLRYILSDRCGWKMGSSSLSLYISI